MNKRNSFQKTIDRGSLMSPSTILRLDFQQSGQTAAAKFMEPLKIVCRGHQIPLDGYFFLSPQKEFPESHCCFDNPEHRFHRFFPFFIRLIRKIVIFALVYF